MSEKNASDFASRLKMFSLFFAILVAGALFFEAKELEAHENAHATFCQYFGGEAVIEYSQEIAGFPFLASGMTTCYTEGINERDKIILDGVNEAASYPFNTLLETIVFCTSVLGSMAVFSK